MSSSTTTTTKICFNSNCKDVLEKSRKGWRLRTGESADLCDRCASAYEEGRFCETFHLDASGWRCCESCGKQVHCGCIVSFHMFVLLDAGGIECITCARKSFILTPNPAWPPHSLFNSVQPERAKDPSVKNWSQIGGSGHVPWRQVPNLFSTSHGPSKLLPRMPFEVDIPSSIDRLNASERLSLSFLEKKKVEDSSEKLTNGSLKHGTSEVPKNGNASEEQLDTRINVSQQPSFSKKDPAIPHFSLVVPPASPNESNDRSKVSGIHAQRLTPPPPVGKQLCGNNGVASTGEAHKRNGRPRGDARGRNKLLPRYWPRISDQELQLISGDSKSVITPLFQKMLSASDAGRIGRLVLPKKCAEAYFPPISQPEGVPLKVLDLKGEEWIFQFRFWPNNNSRMYVLEGVTPCIQSMYLQAGDVVTFSRLEPEGKLVMGFRKTSNTPSDQVNETVNASDGVSTNGDVSCRETKTGKIVSTHHHSKAKEEPAAKSSFCTKRKSGTQGLKSKRQRIDNEDLIELSITRGQAQGILRPPPKHAPSVVVIEGFELEEYEDAPIIGRPTIIPTDHVGEKIQWAQCEDCFKWRKIPADALLPSRWTCSENSWDPERSLCSVAQELTAEQLDGLIPTINQAAAKKMEDGKQDPDPDEVLEGLDRLANLAIQDDGESLSSSSQATTKHPRHRPGCTCIVCIQPPSGKGPKHKQTCTCNVCLTVKRRSGTLMLRREQKQSEKELESSHQNQFPEGGIQFCSTIESSSSPNPKDMASEDPKDDGPSRRKSSLSPFKAPIDLNIQPERDEELSPGSDSGGMMRLIQDATGRYLRQQRFSDSAANTNSGAKADSAVTLLNSASASDR